MGQKHFRFAPKERAKKGQVIGLYGGTFDPPHEGHAHVAQSALVAANLDQIWWLVSPQNPLKTRQAAALETRLELARMFARGPRMVVSDLEARIGARFTIQTIEYLQKHAPGVNFVLVIGGDSLDGLHRWRRWKDIARKVPILIVSRPGFGLKGRLGPLARRFPAARVAEGAGKTLGRRKLPASLYVTTHWRSDSSTDLRAQRAKNLK